MPRLSRVSVLLLVSACYVYVPEAVAPPPAPPAPQPVMVAPPPPPPPEVVEEQPPPPPDVEPVQLDSGDLVGYYGAHPIPDEYGGGWCLVEGPHVHPFPPVWYDQYVYQDGYFVFTSNGGFFYSGPHPISGGGWCNFPGPHRHPYAPGPYYHYDEQNRVYVYERDYHRPIVREADRPAPGWRQPDRVVVAANHVRQERQANPNVYRSPPPRVENHPAPTWQGNHDRPAEEVQHESPAPTWQGDHEVRTVPRQESNVQARPASTPRSQPPPRAHANPPPQQGKKKKKPSN